jgi:hypothetical protein
LDLKNKRVKFRVDVWADVGIERRVWEGKGLRRRVFDGVQEQQQRVDVKKEEEIKIYKIFQLKEDLSNIMCLMYTAN